jgi:CubicO group peptidase (beta-lactamase class C family)
MLPRAIASSILLFLLPAAVVAQDRAASDVGAAVDRIFSQWSTPESPGCAVAVWRAGGTVLTRAYGMADLEHGVPNTVNTVFEAGSVSKQFTAAAIILLAGEGKLSLDDDIRSYLPELPDYGTPITIRHLLHHTSGLRDWGTVVSAAGWPRTRRAHNNAHALDVISRQRSLNYRPGTEYSYTNSGYNLMAIIVERVSGESLAEYTRRMIFQPLGMQRTEWRDDFTRIVRDRATAYSAGPDGFSTLMPFEDVYGNGGLLTTVGDLLLWNENLESGIVGGPALLEEMHRRGRLADGREIAYAGGLMFSSFRGIPEVGHSGSTAGYQAYLTRFPKDDLSVAVLCNVTGTNPGSLAHETADYFLPRRGHVVAILSLIKLSAAEQEALVGLYRNLRTGEPLTLTLSEGELYMNRRTELVPVSRTAFQLGVSESRLEVQYDREYRPVGLRLIADDGDVIDFDRVAEFSPTATELAGYEGEYHSDEAEVGYSVVLSGEVLELRRRPGVTLRLTPVYADAFTASNGWLVRFSRGADGRVEGMGFGMGRVRELVFVRGEGEAR